LPDSPIQAGQCRRERRCQCAGFCLSPRPAACSWWPLQWNCIHNGRPESESKSFMKRSLLLSFAVLALAALSLPASAAILQVGPGKQFATPCAAIAAAAAGDTIQIDSSIAYVGDVCAWATPNLTLQGVGGARAHID